MVVIVFIQEQFIIGNVIFVFCDYKNVYFDGLIKFYKMIRLKMKINLT